VSCGFCSGARPPNIYRAFDSDPSGEKEKNNGLHLIYSPSSSAPPAGRRDAVAGGAPACASSSSSSTLSFLSPSPRSLSFSRPAQGDGAHCTAPARAGPAMAAGRGCVRSARPARCPRGGCLRRRVQARRLLVPGASKPHAAAQARAVG
jgi:hypothetical protein